MSKKIWMTCALTLLAACGGYDRGSKALDFLADDAGLYILPPGSTIAVCDTGVKAGVADFVVKAVRIWADNGGRDERLKIVQGCSGERILKLVRVPDSVPYAGQVSPLEDSTYTVNVSDKWDGHLTANHEVGHLFGFANVYKKTVSIMNSEENGAYMNKGELSSYDLSEIKRLLKSQAFAEVNKSWDNQSGSTPPETTIPLDTTSPPKIITSPDTTIPLDTTSPPKIITSPDTTIPLDTTSPPKIITSPGTTTPDQGNAKSCLGVDGKTVYKHGTVTTYQGKHYRCDQGEWIRAIGL